MKVKIYDLNKFSNLGREINAIIVGKDRVILTDDEACHTVHNLHGTVEFTCDVNVPVMDILEEEPIREEELGTFVRTFGSRIEGNYNHLLESIKDIGLDPKDFPRKVK